MKRKDGDVSQFEMSAANIILITNLKRGMLGKVDFQKTIYLCKQLGVYLPFEFRWDKFGPYSFELAHFVNQLVARNSLSISKGTYLAHSEDPLTDHARELATIDDEMMRRLTALFRSIRQTVHQNGFSIPAFMECLGSIHFIKTSLETSDRRTVFDALEQLKPSRAHKFSPMVEEAWNLLNRNGL